LVTVYIIYELVVVYVSWLQYIHNIWAGCSICRLHCFIQVRLCLRRKLMSWWSYWLNSNFVDSRMIQP